MPRFPGFEGDLMWHVVLKTLPDAALRRAVESGRIPPLALGEAARRLMDDSGPAAAERLLESLFAAPPESLGERLGDALYVLCDAYSAQGKDVEKLVLLESLARSKAAKPLRADAAQRLATLASDRADAAAAWEWFQLAQRLDPQDCSLALLEATLLLSEERTDEAKQRAGFWLRRFSRRDDVPRDLLHLRATAAARMKAIAIIAVAMFAVRAEAAAPLEVFGEYGQCRLQVSKDGDFWQSGRETYNYLTPRCAALGVGRRFQSFWNDAGRSKWGWRASVLVTGSFESRGNVASFRDDEKDNFTLDASTCQDDGRGCMTVHRGQGDLKGLRLSLTHTTDLGRGWQLVPEAGLLFHRILYRNEAKWIDGEGPARHCTNAECRRIRTEDLPGNYDHSEWRDVFKSSPALTLGVALRYRSVYATWRRDIQTGGRPLSLTSGNMDELLFGVAIPIR